MPLTDPPPQPSAGLRPSAPPPQPSAGLRPSAPPPAPGEGARVALLDRAVRLESRSFLEYLHHTAPPVDIGKHPAVAKGFEEIAGEEDEIVQELADAIVDLGAHPASLGTYELTYGAYNYVTTDYALKVLGEKLSKNLARFDEILAEAKGDPVVEPILAAIRERKARHVERLRELRAALRSPPPAPAAAPAAPAPAAANRLAGH